MNIHVSREELIDLTKKVYQKACNGFLDLAETICSSEVEKLIENNKKNSNFSTNDLVYNPYSLSPENQSWVIGASSTINTSDQTTWQWNQNFTNSNYISTSDITLSNNIT